MFNVNQVEKSQPSNFELIKPGIYTIVCESADLKRTQKNDLMWSFKLTIVDSLNYDGRKLFPTCMFTHSNPETVRIGKTQLADMCFAAEIEEFKTEDELISLIVDRLWQVKVGVKLNKEKQVQENYCVTHYTLKGEHRSYDALPQQAPQTRKPAPQRQPAPQQQEPAPQNRAQQQYEQQYQQAPPPPMPQQPQQPQEQHVPWQNPQEQRQVPWQQPQQAPVQVKPSYRQSAPQGPTEEVPF